MRHQQHHGRLFLRVDWESTEVKIFELLERELLLLKEKVFLVFVLDVFIVKEDRSKNYYILVYLVIEVFVFIGTLNDFKILVDLVIVVILVTSSEGLYPLINSIKGHSLFIQHVYYS